MQQCRMVKYLDVRGESIVVFVRCLAALVYVVATDVVITSIMARGMPPGETDFRVSFIPTSFSNPTGAEGGGRGFLGRPSCPTEAFLRLSTLSSLLLFLLLPRPGSFSAVNVFFFYSLRGSWGGLCSWPAYSLSPPPLTARPSFTFCNEARNIINKTTARSLFLCFVAAAAALVVVFF
jgi:hypothetical protein